MDGTRQSIGGAGCLAPLRRPAATAAGGAVRRLRAPFAGLLPVAAALLLLAISGVVVAAGDDKNEGSRLPLPRFASLKYDHVNVRRGPEKDQDVTWVYTRTALPVEITEEFDNWRRIRDHDGSEGWVHHTLLSGKRTAYVAHNPVPPPRPARSQPAAPQPPDLVAIHVAANAESAVSAMLEPGVVGTVRRCDGRWCRLVGPGFDGFIDQSRLWGVYPNEKIE